MVTMGGAWKGHPVMLEAFAEEVKAAYPSAEIISPVYDPVVGCVVLRARREGMAMGDIKEKLHGKFDAYLLRKGGDV